MAKAMRVPVRDDLVHKRAQRSEGRRGPQSICGRYGYQTHLWKNVTCQICVKRRSAASLKGN